MELVRYSAEENEHMWKVSQKWARGGGIHRGRGDACAVISMKHGRHNFTLWFVLIARCSKIHALYHVLRKAYRGVSSFHSLSLRSMSATSLGQFDFMVPYGDESECFSTWYGAPKPLRIGWLLSLLLVNLLLNTHVGRDSHTLQEGL